MSEVDAVVSFLQVWRRRLCGVVRGKRICGISAKMIREGFAEIDGI